MRLHKYIKKVIMPWWVCWILIGILGLTLHALHESRPMPVKWRGNASVADATIDPERRELTLKMVGVNDPVEFTVIDPYILNAWVKHKMPSVITCETYLNRERGTCFLPPTIEAGKK